jgi:hypothetical protein
MAGTKRSDRDDGSSIAIYPDQAQTPKEADIMPARLLIVHKSMEIDDLAGATLSGSHRAGIPTQWSECERRR